MWVILVGGGVSQVGVRCGVSRVGGGGWGEPCARGGVSRVGLG